MLCVWGFGLKGDAVPVWFGYGFGVVDLLLMGFGLWAFCPSDFWGLCSLGALLGFRGF